MPTALIWKAILVAAVVTAAPFLYVLVATLAVLLFRRRPQPTGVRRPPVTVLKPVCGLEVDLYENLRSFCEQDYPAFQVLFGVRDADDPAIPVIERLIADLPEGDLDLVVDGRTIGPNLKVSNLANLHRRAKHDIVIVADSDMRVGRGYLAAVTAPFDDPGVGAVTCLYKGTASGGLASTLGAMFINEWFFPSVLVALIFQPLRFCFGATMAARRAALEAIGGFEALAWYLADDHYLGKLIGAQGYEVVLSRYVVENIVHEPSFMALCRHELRWARTVSSAQAVGYAFSFVTYAVPMAILASLAVGLSTGVVEVEVGVIVGAIVLRLLLHWAACRTLDVRQSSAFWLVPVRDILCFMIWVASFFGRTVEWRGGRYAVTGDGILVMSRERDR